MAAVRNSEVVRLLTEGNFGIYLLGNAISLTGSWMQRVACLYLIWELTGSAFWLGVLAMADMMPVLVIGLFAGAAADRWSRLALTRICQLIIVINATVFGTLAALQLLNLPLIIALALVQGCVIAVAQPARMALVQVLVSRDQVGQAVALSAVNLNIARLIGPAIAGFLLVTASAQWVFFLNALLTSIFVAVLLRIPADPPPANAGKSPMLSLIRDGIAYAASNRATRTLLILLFVGGAAVRSIAELFPAFAVRNFDSSATGLAVLTSSMAAGAVVAGLSLGISSKRVNLGRRISVSWALASVSVCVLAASSFQWLDVLSALLVGAFVMRSVISTQTFVQLAAPEDMRGRVLSVHGLVSRGSPPLGALAIGASIDAFGLMEPVIAFASICLVVAVVSLQSPADFSHKP